MKKVIFLCICVLLLRGICLGQDLSETETLDEEEYNPLNEYDDLLLEPVVQGSFRFNFGFEDSEGIVKKANYSQQEETWRYLFGEDKYNTYDPAIFNQFKLSILSPIDERLSVYTKIVIDPWAFVGTSQTITLPTWYGAGDANDPVELQLKYFSSNTRTYAQTVRSASGDSFDLPESKVVKGNSRPGSDLGSFGFGTHRLDIPELDIDMEFKPIRSFWLDFREDEYRVRFFLYAEDSMGLYFDDPLRLCGNHINWEPSPWFDKWQPGRLYTATGWARGEWIRDYLLRNSQEEFLNLLRGIRLDINGIEYDGSFMIAAPVDPWEDYDDINNVPVALRLKKHISDELTLGTLYTARTGYNKDSLDAFDQVLGIDSKLKFLDEYSLALETAVSKNGRHLNDEDFKTYEDDFAYAAIFGANIQPFELNLASKLSYVYMGREFDPPLSNYDQTRNDQSWGEHIWFSNRSRAEETYRIGNSIDQDRKVAALAMNLGPMEGFNYFFDLRNVRTACDDAFVENVFRNEMSYKADKNLLYKFLYIFNKRPKTTEGKQQDTNTVSGGVKYDFLEDFSIEEILERTNKYPAYPGELYDWLTINPIAPYPYYSMSKTRLIYNPYHWVEVAFEHTYNEFDHATTLDDFMNYSGIDAFFRPFDDLTARFVYRYSRVADYSDNNNVKGHHNFYVDLMYDLDEDAQIGIRFSEIVSDFYGLGWESTVLDTQKIIRVVYQGKF
ncbi:MAG: hypothetical protein ABII88_00270 [Candidatus Omnitrophota bacterium]